MQQLRLTLIDEESSERALGQQVLSSVLEGYGGSWYEENVLKCVWMIVLYLENIMLQSVMYLDFKWQSKPWMNEELYIDYK